MDTEIISTLLHTINDERSSPYTPIRVINSSHETLYEIGTVNLILPNILRSKKSLQRLLARARAQVLDAHASQSPRVDITARLEHLDATLVGFTCTIP
jgi:hypothetical protein